MSQLNVVKFPSKTRAIVYIAGPMTGYPDFNHSAFHAAEKYLYSMGYDLVFSPARMDPNPPIEAASGTTHPHVRKVLEEDTQVICRSCTDIFMLSGWEKSLGAQAEWALAKALGLRITYQ